MRTDLRRLARRGTVLLAAAAALTMGVTGADAAGTPRWHKPQTKEIASSVLEGRLEFTLTAVRSRRHPLEASVVLRVFVSRRGHFVQTDQTLVGRRDGWFWFPVTGASGICGFSTASTDPAPVAVSLLVTPSVGCSPAARFRVHHGRFLHPGAVERA